MAHPPRSHKSQSPANTTMSQPARHGSFASTGVNVLAIPELGSLDSNHVAMPEAEASEIAHRGWSIQAVAKRLSTEKDDTFELEDDSGEKYLLKMATPSERAVEIDLEICLVEHILASSDGLPLPQHLPSRDGQQIVKIHDQAGQARLARLMEFLDGTPLDSTDSSALERERVGESLAKLRLATAGFSHPADDRRCAWDISNLHALEPLIATVSEQRQFLVRSAFARYMEFAAPSVPSLRRQMLHNDFSKSNILVDHDQPSFVTGIVDFGDAVRTAIVIDVSTALLNQLPRNAAEQPTEDLFIDARDVLRGYLRIADLTPFELALLPHLVMGRVIARAVISHFLADRRPDKRDYVLRNTDQGWAQLDWFMNRSPQEISSSFS